MRSNRDSGHAVLITITIILGVAILALLGWVFWRNFLNKPAATTTTTTTSTTTTKTTPNTDLTQSTTATYNGKTLTIKYPASWQNVTDGTVGSGITSPDGNTIIKYTLLPPDGIGGACGDPTTPVSDPIVYATWEAIPGTSDAIFASYIAHHIKTADAPNATDYYSYMFAAMKNSDAIKNVKTGDSACEPFLFADYVILPDNSGAALQARVIFKNLYMDNLTGQRLDTTQKEVQDTITSADAQTAQKIIESITIK